MRLAEVNPVGVGCAVDYGVLSPAGAEEVLVEVLASSERVLAGAAHQVVWVAHYHPFNDARGSAIPPNLACKALWEGLAPLVSTFIFNECKASGNAYNAKRGVRSLCPVLVRAEARDACGPFQQVGRNCALGLAIAVARHHLFMIPFLLKGRDRVPRPVRFRQCRLVRSSGLRSTYGSWALRAVRRGRLLCRPSHPASASALRAGAGLRIHAAMVRIVLLVISSSSFLLLLRSGGTRGLASRPFVALDARPSELLLRTGLSWPNPRRYLTILKLQILAIRLPAASWATTFTVCLPKERLPLGVKASRSVATS